MLHILAKSLGDLETLGKVRTGGILRRINHVQGVCKKLSCKVNDLIVKTIPDIKASISTAQTDIGRHKAKVSADHKQLDSNLTRLALEAVSVKKALTGDMHLKVFPMYFSLTASELNAAEAGTIKRTVNTYLKSMDGTVHDWATFTPALVSTEAVTDGDIDAPAIEGSPAFKKGSSTVVAVLDTDAGVTKTYSAPIALTGTLTFTADSVDVTGVGTFFTTELAVGDYIQLDADTAPAKIESITDDANLVLLNAYTAAGGEGATSKLDVVSITISVADGDKMLGHTVAPATALFVVTE